MCSWFLIRQAFCNVSLLRISLFENKKKCIPASVGVGTRQDPLPIECVNYFPVISPVALVHVPLLSCEFEIGGLMCIILNGMRDSQRPPVTNASGRYFKYSGAVTNPTARVIFLDSNSPHFSFSFFFPLVFILFFTLIIVSFSEVRAFLISRYRPVYLDLQKTLNHLCVCIQGDPCLSKKEKDPGS